MSNANTTVLVTVNSFMNALGIQPSERAAVTGFLNTLVQTGDAEEAGTKTRTREVSPGVHIRDKGKGENLYRIPRTISIQLPDDLQDVQIPPITEMVKQVSVKWVPAPAAAPVDPMDEVEAESEVDTEQLVTV